jgi:hypothetical protein
MGVMRRRFGRLLRAVAGRLGYDIVRRGPSRPSAPTWPVDFEPADIEICRRVAPFTMTSPERIHALRRAVHYVVERDVPGAIVECGVWRGGSMMVVAHTLLELSRPSYDLYLFDTFDGMTPPTEHDRNLSGTRAADLLERSSPDAAVWAHSPIEQTRAALQGTGYPRDRIHFVPGRVEDTIPKEAPEQVALLRLDTDWYESTHHELVHLYPRVSTGGVLIIDDYGHWQGARKATDEYLAEQKVPLLLNRIDYTGRIGVKA